MLSKRAKVEELLRSFEKVAIAFSGGVDSSLLAYLATKALGQNAHIYTFVTPYMASKEIEEAKALAQAYHFNHHVIEVGTPDSITNNPTERCYLCKTVLFTMLQQAALKDGIVTIADGSNADDVNDYRPGMRALKELEVRSPFMELGISKNDVRSISKELGLPTWDVPSNPCLLTRLPYGTPVSEEAIRQVEYAEDFLKEKGFKIVRVRHEGETARIEVPEEDRTKLFDSVLSQEIIEKFKALGFVFIAVDIKGFKSGNMNQTI